MASVRGRYLGGESAVFEDCATVGDIMVRVAGEEQRFASDVVVLPVGSGEVLPYDHIPPPDVSIVLKKEDPQLDEEECKISITLHAAAEDTPTVVRALAMLQNAVPDTDWPEEMLYNAARHAEKEKIVRTLMRAGLDGGGALARASRDGDTGAVRRLISAGANVNHVEGEEQGSVLMEASWEGHKEVVQILLDAGADVNHLDVNNWSASACASHYDHFEVERILNRAKRSRSRSSVSDERED
eukprot:GEMP01078809.1.p1 GENE.GEMP01078809.1~~GEMP01078809.1.p1  ORF type:complete len:242 (-),score=67.18 GEMP01078809.1:321-1046(-)